MFFPRYAALSPKYVGTAFIAVTVLILCHSGSAYSGTSGLRYNQPALTAIDEEIAVCADERTLAVLRGLRWCVTFCEDDANFDFTFTNYVTMLDELTVKHTSPAVSRIVHDLIMKEFERALPRFNRLFTADASGYEDFILILPIAYHHHVPLDPLKEFASRRFAKVKVPDRLKEFREAARGRNYDLLTDLVVGATFVDMAYRWGADKDFRLPHNNYHAIIGECARIPFRARSHEDTYHDQNYYATHVLLALNHYGQIPLNPSVTSEKALSYLAGQYKMVRYGVGDLDLLCEYLYCFRQCAPGEVEFIREGEGYILSQQRSDGSWGTTEDFKGDPYDRLHPTWTAITLLALGNG